jgi:two-component system chemotaxis response regulator CheB
LSGKIRVLIIDDSALMRQVLQSLLEQDSTLEVVGGAADPIIAWRKIQHLRPDVLTLDVEMPRMDGLSFLKHLMAEHPLPVVMISSLTELGCDTTFRALELGAIDFVTKPRTDIRERMPEMAREVIEKIKTAAAARHYVRLQSKIRHSKARIQGRNIFHPSPPVPMPVSMPVPLSMSMFIPQGAGAEARAWAVAEAWAPEESGRWLPSSAPPVIAVGASTGGTEAIRQILSGLPADFPGMVIVQHMPPKFTRAFAERLNALGPMRVSEAEDGGRVLVGHVLIAPGDFHMILARDGAGYQVRLNQEPAVHHHRPSVDILFLSCAQVARGNALGLLLTGMGEDGARGLLEMRQAGARTLVQDEASSVVFGMPKAAIDQGAAEQVLPLGDISAALQSLVHSSTGSAKH